MRGSAVVERMRSAALQPRDVRSKSARTASQHRHRRRGVTTDTLSGHRRRRRLWTMDDRLSSGEIRKDVLQETAQSVASTVGEVTAIITTAVRDVFGAIGALATDLFEIREGARRAQERSDDTME